MRKRIVCFGEIMLRLNPEGYLRILQAKSFEASYAGSEASVAVSLSTLGYETEFVTKLPEHEVGQAANNTLRQYGVGTKYIIRDAERLGIYFVEKGASQRPSKVIYDRQYSSIALAKMADFDWEVIFKEADWFHFSGITPALGGELPEILLLACQTAKSLGVKVSCDLNYREKLWTSEEAKEVMSTLMPYVDICVANEEDAEKVFGIVPEKTGHNFSHIHAESYKSSAKQLMERFDLSYVAFTLRESISANQNLWSSLLFNGTEYVQSPKYDMQIVDRLGGGDSFSAGMIYALLTGYPLQKAVDFATAASCLKHSIEQDFNLTTLEEILNLSSGDASGRVQR